MDAHLSNNTNEIDCKWGLFISNCRQQNSTMSVYNAGKLIVDLLRSMDLVQTAENFGEIIKSIPRKKHTL